MADLLIRRAGRVLTWTGPVVVDAAVFIEGGKVTAVVPESRLGRLNVGADTPELDAGGRAIIPGFVDAHTHLVFAGDRSDEFAARLAGTPYEAGGIMSTVAATRAAPLESLVEGVLQRAEWCLSGGTTTVEAKSGYGLTTESEYLQLRALAAAGSRTALTIVPTFLAHLAPDPGHVELVVSEMLPVCAGLAVSCDAFCDSGALTVDESRRVLEAGQRWGLIPRLHAEELAWTGGAQLAASLGCASADHLVHATAEDASALAASGVVAVLLPATSFSLRSSYAPARMLIDHGVTIALASDCNPGTSYTTSMPFVIALACSAYGLSADEAIRAATLGGALALRRPDIGHLGPGACGDAIVLDADHWIDIPYHPGMPVISSVVKNGVVVRDAHGSHG